MTCEVIEAHDLFDQVQSFLTLWEWSEAFLRQGFRLAVTDPKVVARAWKIEVKSNEGDFPWYPDGESMRHCFFTKPGARHLLIATAGRRVGAAGIPLLWPFAVSAFR